MLYGLGVLHGRHRPLQSLLLPCAGSGRLSEKLAPLSALTAVDTLAHRLDLPRLGAKEATLLDAWTGERLDSYLAGLRAGLSEGGRPFELTVLLASLPPPDRPSLISGFLLSAYLGLAEGQSRMEKAICASVAQGARPELLRQMFAPHLDGWDPNLASPGQNTSQMGSAAAWVGGSNAWAVDGRHTESGSPMLAGDPHLVVNQLPALFFEVRLRTPDNYFIGATIPGLPGLAIGRTKHIAWSGTFSVADNVDHFVERTPSPNLVQRTVHLNRRFAKGRTLNFFQTARGTLDAPPPGVAEAWAGSAHASEAIEAYLRLMFATSADDAVRVLMRAHTLGLHFVIADRDGVRYRQNGRIPRRTGNWSGLYPVSAHDPVRKWDGFYTGATLPTEWAPEDGVVITANEARLAPDGGVLSTLAQPSYRFDRIRERLLSQSDHNLATFQSIQLDLLCGQAVRLAPIFERSLLEGPLRQALRTWDRQFAVDSRGAAAFAVAYRFARDGLAEALGGGWFRQMLKDSELPIWWCAGIDRVLSDQTSWARWVGRPLSEVLAPVAHLVPEPLGANQTVTHRNLILGGLSGLGFDRGPYPMPGSIGTVCQGSVFRTSGAEVVVAPAYRFITDMSEDAAYTSLPGGIDGSRFSSSYDRWLDDHHAGRYHRLEPPES